MQFMNRFKKQPSAEDQIVENLAAGRDADEDFPKEKKLIDSTSSTKKSEEKKERKPPAPTNSFSNFLARRKSSIVKLTGDFQQSLKDREQIKQWEETDEELVETLKSMEQVRERIKEQQLQNKTELADYQKELQEIRSTKTSTGRDLWLKAQNHKLNPLVVKEYYEYLLEEGKAVEELSKDELKTLTAEAKLLKAQHNEAMTNTQMAMVRDFQQDLIDFLYSGMLPSLKNEKITVEQEGQEKLKTFKVQKEELSQLYAKTAELQDKILEEYRSKLTPEQMEEIEQEKAAEEAAKKALEEGEENDGSDDESEDEQEEDEEDAPPAPTSSPLQAMAAMSPFSSRKNTAVTSTSSSDKTAPAKPAAAMTLQERIAARAAERKAAGAVAAPKVNSATAVSNSKTSRSDLLERARRSREQSEANKEIAALTTGSKEAAKENDLAPVQRRMSNSSVGSSQSLGRGSAHSKGSRRSSMGSMGSQNSSRSLNSRRSLRRASINSAASTTSQASNNSRNSANRRASVSGATASSTTTPTENAKQPTTASIRSPASLAGRRTGASGGVARTASGGVTRPSTLGTRRPATGAAAARRPMTSRTGVTRPATKAAGSVNTGLSEERRAQIRAGLRNGNANKQ